MIYDVLSNSAQYAALNADIVKALEAAKAYNADNYPSEPVVIEEGNIWLNAAKYTTHSTEKAVFEAHQQFIDVMIMIDGEETIYVKNTDKLSHVYQEYKPEVEALLADFDTDATPVAMKPGYFCVLMPQDAHSPGCDPATGASNVKKFIGKVRIR